MSFKHKTLNFGFIATIMSIALLAACAGPAGETGAAGAAGAQGPGGLSPGQRHDRHAHGRRHE